MEQFQQTCWQPRALGIAALGLGGLMLAIICVTSVTDLPGRVLAGFAGAGLMAFATMSWRARPKLAITAAGLVVRGWFSTVVLARNQIALIRITEFRRIGRKVRLLEIDGTDERLYVFTRWDLGTDPIEVLDALTNAGYADR
jgi:Bacterial PH domain